MEYALVGTIKKNPAHKKKEGVQKRLNEEGRKSRERNARFQRRIDGGEVFDPSTAGSVAELLYFSGKDGFVGWHPNTTCMYGALDARGTL